MRVMQVHFWSDARNLTGSVEKVLAGFATLAAPDIEMDVASCGKGEPQKIGRATYVFFREGRLRNRILNKWLGLKAFTYPALVRLIEARRPDILHFHNRQGLVDGVVGRLSYRPRVLVHYHRNFRPYVIPGSADLLVAVSDALRQDILAAARPGVPVEVVHNPAPVDMLAAAAGSERKAGGRPHLFYGGGRQDHKGFPELEAALASPALAGRFDVSLCGPRLEGYQSPFPARVLGMLSQADFMDELQQADVVAMPSHREGFPLLALETMASGKVLVTTEAGGLREIANPANAILHAVGDRDSLAGALGRAAALFEAGSEDRLDKLRQAAQATVENFSPAAVTARLADLYRSCLQP